MPRKKWRFINTSLALFRTDADRVEAASSPGDLPAPWQSTWLPPLTNRETRYCLSHGYIKSRCISVPTNIVRDFYCAPGSGFSYLKMVGSSTKLNIFILRILFRNPPCEAKTIHFQLLIQSRSSMRKPLSKNGQDFLNIRYNRGFNMDLDLIFSLLNLYSVLRIHNLIENHGTSRHTNSRTISWTWIDFKMADTSERRVFCNTILLKYHVENIQFSKVGLFVCYLLIEIPTLNIDQILVHFGFQELHLLVQNQEGVLVFSLL